MFDWTKRRHMKQDMKNSIKAVIVCSFCAVLCFASGLAYGDDACTGDIDCDGLQNSIEDSNGNGTWEPELGETDPRNPDSDGDGLTDGEEILHIGRVEELLLQDELAIKFPERLDPLDADSDGDCLPDGLEVGVDEVAMLSLLARMPDRPKYIPSARCKGILEAGLTGELENAIPFDENAPLGLHNMSALYDLDVETITDPTNDDMDSDGVMDGLEDDNFSGHCDANEETPDVLLEMDPTNPDSDDDGLLDGEEGDRDGNGTVDEDESSPISRDTDHDGVDDGDEDRAGTKPGKCDSDEDGLSDGVEMGRIQPNEIEGCHGLMAAGTNFKKPTEMNPLNPDSDGDGLTDGEEDMNSNGWLDHDESDPSITDTDGDTLTDGVEAKGDFDSDGTPDFDYRLIQGGRDCSPPKVISDLDCDGVPNARDDDSDGDGCSDVMEGAFSDDNTNGIPDVYDPQAKICPEEAAPGGAGGSPSTSPEEETEGDGGVANLKFGSQDGGGACTLAVTDVTDRVSTMALVVIFLLIVPLFTTYLIRPKNRSK